MSADTQTHMHIESIAPAGPLKCSVRIVFSEQIRVTYMTFELYITVGVVPFLQNSEHVG